MVRKIKGSVLLFSVIISLLVVGLMLFLLPLNSFMFKQYANFSNEKQVYKTTSSVLLLLLNSKIINAQLEPSYYNSFSNTIVKQERWGLFELATISTSKGRSQNQQIFLIGQNFYPSSDTITLTIPQINSAVFCTGNATLTGKIRVPKEGIRASYVDGNIFSGSFKNAQVLSVSSASMPSISNFSDESLNHYLSPEQLLKDSYAEYTIVQTIVDSINVSFSESPLLLHSRQMLEIKNAKVSGKVIISSNERVIIDGYSTVNDCIIIAPVVKIGKGFKGNLQIFAIDTVVLDEDVYLGYPSVVALRQENRSTPSFINIGNNSSLDGALLVIRPNDIRQYFRYPRVNIASNSKVRGLIYVQGLLDARGKLLGATLTEHFYFQSFSGFYLNYLNNGHLTMDGMPSEYAVPFIFENTWKKCLVKELN